MASSFVFLLRPAVDAMQAIGTVFGIGGALILALQGIPPAWGFLAWLVSNLAWLAFASALRLRGLLLQHVVYLVITLIGLWGTWPSLAAGR